MGWNDVVLSQLAFLLLKTALFGLLTVLLFRECEANVSERSR